MRRSQGKSETAEGGADDRFTGGVARVDDAQYTRAATITCLAQSAPQLCDVQSPGALFVQVVVHLHGVQLSQGSRVQWVLRNGNEYTRSCTALASYQQLEHCLWAG